MIDSKQLLHDASGWVRRLEDDLRDGCDEHLELDARVRAEFDAARTGHRTAVAYGEWREDFLTQVAVAWVLAGVFVRFMEDNGLLEAPFLSGPGERLDRARDARRLFFRAQPTLSDREYLEHVFRTVAQVPAVAGLFDERHNPLWTLGPSPDGAAALLAFWQHKDPDTGELRHDFTDRGDEAVGRAPWDTRFLGDLYQDLSERARKRYALLQTPRFVESFILDRTLTPALDTFGLDGLRLIDPTCGSGHFLLGGFDRIFTRWSREAPGLSDRDRVLRTLGSLHGVDLNPFAVAIARFRLTVRALQAAGERIFAQAPVFPLNVATGDALLHGPAPAGGGTQGVMAFHPLAHVYHAEDREMLERILQPGGYHAVVGNPPYITVKDAVVSEEYRKRWASCSGTYSLAVPFFERFFHLAVPGNGRGDKRAGFVGMITADSFMKREFGAKLVEKFIPYLDLTHVISTAGAYLPGHGTPTVIIFGRNQQPVAPTVRSVLGIQGEPSTPADPALGVVWQAILAQINHPGSESEWVSVSERAREVFHKHPWSIGGGGAAELKEQIESNVPDTLEKSAELPIGRAVRIGEKEVFIFDKVRFHHSGVPSQEFRGYLMGEEVRDWRSKAEMLVWYPYLKGAVSSTVVHRLWRWRTPLANRMTFQGRFADVGMDWFRYQQHTASAYRSPLSIAFAEIATHNHFVLDRGGNVFEQTAPVIKLPLKATEDDHLNLIGLLNSSTACFWLKQVCHNKGSTVDQQGARQRTAAFEDFYSFNGTKIAEFPVPADKPLRLATELDRLARELSTHAPAAVLARWTRRAEVGMPPAEDGTSPAASPALHGTSPTLHAEGATSGGTNGIHHTESDNSSAADATLPVLLNAARAAWDAMLGRMISLQEELDWFCYRAYGLVTDDLIACDPLAVPPLRLGERTFEIFLARQIAQGGMHSSWFERHGSTPLTTPPTHWPADYTTLYHRRHAAMQDNRDLALIERPEYKRRWNVEPWAAQETRACRAWLLDRLETSAYWPAVALTSAARLADYARADADFNAVAERFTGRPDYDLPRLVAELVRAEGVPYLPALRYKESGRRKRALWEETWRLQREEDRIDSEAATGLDTAGERQELARERKAREVGPIPVPPKYATGDFQETSYWRLRGKLDVPRERFILYPGAERAADPSPVLAWAGWDHLQQAGALAAYYEHAKTQEGWERARLLPLLAGLHDLVPWLKQWHNDLHPEFDQRMGDFYADYVESEARAFGVTLPELKAWEPPARSTGRGRRVTRAVVAS